MDKSWFLALRLHFPLCLRVFLNELCPDLKACYDALTTREYQHIISRRLELTVMEIINKNCKVISCYKQTREDLFRMVIVLALRSTIFRMVITVFIYKHIQICV